MDVESSNNTESGAVTNSIDVEADTSTPSTVKTLHLASASDVGTDTCQKLQSEQPAAQEIFDHTTKTPTDYSNSQYIENIQGVKPKRRMQGEMITIRLFISSTFVDTHGERDVLIRKVSIVKHYFAHFRSLITEIRNWKHSHQRK